MDIRKWYGNLCQQEDVRALIPMEWQPAPPQPVLRNGSLWLYVPCQRVWVENGNLLCSDKLAEIWFFGPEKKIASFDSLRQTEGADPKSVLAACELDEVAIYRSNLVLERYLLELDRLEKTIKRDGKPAPGQWKACQKLLKEALIIPGQSALYEGMEA